MSTLLQDGLPQAYVEGLLPWASSKTAVKAAAQVQASDRSGLALWGWTGAYRRSGSRRGPRTLTTAYTVFAELGEDPADASIQFGNQGQPAARCELDRHTDEVSLVWPADAPLIDPIEVRQIRWDMSACVAARISAHSIVKDGDRAATEVPGS